MTRRWGTWPSAPGSAPSGVLIGWLGVALAMGPAGCQPPSSPAAAAKAVAPAKVSTPTREADLATVTLTPEAEERLGLGLAAAERKSVPRTSTYGGEVVIPSGRLIAVSSPFNGTLKAPEGTNGSIPTPGQSVKQGQTIFNLVPILSPESRATMAPLLIEAQGQVKQMSEQLKIAKVTLDRAENLVRDRLGGSAALVDARAQYDLAQTNLRAAEQRREILAKVASDAESGASDAQVIASPAGGLLNNLLAMPGQKVAAGAVLFDVASLDPIWVKVPVYVGDLARLAADRDASIGGVAAPAGGSGARPGKPVNAPPSGDPMAATVNIFYEVANHDGLLRPGQRVGVTLPMKGEDEDLTVPLASLLRDIHGNAWVYEKTGDHAFTRRRVLVDRVVNDLAVLAAADLKPGARVVTDGAAEIFGAEFGGGK